jgi:hypothetical protein
MAVSSFNALASASASTNNLYWFDLASAESKRSNLGFTSDFIRLAVSVKQTTHRQLLTEASIQQMEQCLKLLPQQM